MDRILGVLLANLFGFAYRCVLDEHWTMLFMSEGVRATTGFPAEEFLADKITYESVIDPRDRDWVRDRVVESVERDEPFQFTYRIVTADGEQRWVWEQGRMVHRDNERSLLEGYITDVTGLSTLESSDRLSSSAGISDRIAAASVAHDVANLLMGAQFGATELRTHLNANPRHDPALVNEELDELEETLHRAARLMTRLVSEEELGNGHGQRPLDLEVLALEGVLQRASQQRLSLFLEAPSAFISLSSVQLEGLLVNLVINAVEAGASSIIVKTSVHDSAVRITVTDNGSGVSRELLDSIFEVHFTTKGKGKGLGLATARREVVQAGGTLTVTSHPGDTSFVAEFPRLTEPHSTTTVLVYEPNHAVRRLATAHIAKLGATVIPCVSLEDAERALESEGASIDVLVTDVLSTAASRALVETARSRNSRVGVIPLSRLLARAPWADPPDPQD